MPSSNLYAIRAHQATEKMQTDHIGRSVDVFSQHAAGVALRTQSLQQWLHLLTAGVVSQLHHHPRLTDSQQQHQHAVATNTVR